MNMKLEYSKVRLPLALVREIKVSFLLATNMEKDGMNLISSNESLATLSKYDVQETFDNDKIKEKYSQFEKFVEVRKYLGIINFNQECFSVCQKVKNW